MFCRALGIPEPHLSAREETNTGEKDLQRVGRQPGLARGGLEENPIVADRSHKAMWSDLACRQVSLLVRRGEELAADS